MPTVANTSECTVEQVSPGLFFVVARGNVDEKMATAATQAIDEQAKGPFRLVVDGGEIIAYTPGFRHVWTKWFGSKRKDELLSADAYLTGALTNMALTLANLATGNKIKGHSSRDSLYALLDKLKGAA